MNRNELLTYISAILTTILEVSPTDPIPASSIYLAMGMNLQNYELVRDVMVKCNWVVATSSTIALTSEGRAKATELENALVRK